jgi:hypothetical protein
MVTGRPRGASRARAALATGGVLAALTILAPAARAQVPRPTTQPELRLDGIFGHQPAVQLGAGVQIPMGYYVRVGLDAAVGVATEDRTALIGSADVPPGPLDGRVDLLIRFLLDPFRQSAFGLSLGGGVSARAEPGDHVRPRLLVALDVEGRRSARGVVPALQVGLGGGLRVGVVLRRGARLMR